MKSFNLIGFLCLAIIFAIPNCKMTPIEINEQGAMVQHSEAYDSFKVLLASAKATSICQEKEFQAAINRPRTKAEKVTIRTNRKAKILMVHPNDGSTYYSN